jgi:hypothetical protein
MLCVVCCVWKIQNSPDFFKIYRFFSFLISETDLFHVLCGTEEVTASCVRTCQLQDLIQYTIYMMAMMADGLPVEGGQEDLKELLLKSFSSFEAFLYPRSPFILKWIAIDGVISQDDNFLWVGRGKGH